MDELWQVIAELAFELHPDRVAVIAEKIASLKSVDEFRQAKSSFGPNADLQMVGRLERSWQNAKEARPAEIAAALRGASLTSAIAESRGAVELVWTGPSTGMVPVRHTEQVLCEVIESARWRLFLVSFVAYEVEAIVRALRGAVGRQVQIDVLLEVSTEHGGRVTFDSVRAMKTSVPSANVYIWNTEKSEAKRIAGAVHAKCAVADGSIAFITSANLTTAAMERNMELGVLVKGGTLPDSLDRHLDALISTEIIKRA